MHSKHTTRFHAAAIRGLANNPAVTDEELLEVVCASLTQNAALVSGAAEPVVNEKAAEVKKPVAEAPAAATGKSTAKPETTAPKAPASTPSAPSYDDVKAQILAMAKDKGREITGALLSRYGVTKGPDLKPEQYADFMADVARVLAGEYDPTASTEPKEEEEYA